MKKNSYTFSLILIGGIITGALLGAVLKDRAAALKPLGDIFLNLLFTVVVPMVFFSISSAVAGMTDLRRLGRIMGWMMLVFVGTGIVAALVMAAGVTLFPPAQGLAVEAGTFARPEAVDVPAQIVKAFTVSDFSDLLSRRNMLALIVFALLVGLATSAVGEKGSAFREFLLSGNAVMSRVIGYVMWYAPVGLGAYFAYLVGTFGPQLFGTYVRVMALYYPLALGYFFIAFSFYAWLAAGRRGLGRFWGNIIPTSLTAWGTGSSVATVPVNLAAARRVGVPEDIREVVIPIGATIHMDGSSLAAVLKIAVLFGFFQMDFTGPGTIAGAVAVALLSGTVISGIPAGGMIGELLIVTLYGFPIEALPIITMVGTLVDPPATMVNAAGDNVSSMLVARALGGKNWLPVD